MGSCGSGSKSGAKGGGLSKASDAKNFNELKSYMESQGVKFGDGLENMDLGLLKSAAEEIQYFRQEFPQAADSFMEINGVGSGGYAETHYSKGAIQLTSHFASGNAETLQNSYVKSTQMDDYDKIMGHSAPFHPVGTTSANIASHEAGHILEKALIDKRTDPGGIIGKVTWNKGTEATRIVSNAAKEVKKTPEGKGKRIDQLVGQISRYAGANRSEALAEAVADYRANGANAKPLSKAIWSELKKELG